MLIFAKMPIFGKIIFGLFIIFMSMLANAQNRITVDPQSRVDQEGLWNGPVHVCWENPESFSQEIAWVEETVLKHIEGTNQDVSGVRFVGITGQRRPWGKCGTSDLGIRIRIADEWPRSLVGQQWQRDSSGKRIRTSTGKLLGMPTSMTLNMTFVSGFECLDTTEHCIRAIALHEFMHALGFLHEHLRDDAPPACKEKYKAHADFPGFKPIDVSKNYDSDSHMSYCANMYRKPIHLSQEDASALLALYPL